MANPGGVLERIITLLRERILSDELPQGTRLAQADLAAQFGVSRIPVRDALRRLANEGLVEFPSKGSAVVAPLSLSDLQELYDLRGAVEPLVCRLAVPHVGRAQLLVMAGCLERMEHLEASPEWLQAHAIFHAQVYGQSGRPRSIALVENLRQQTERYLRLHLSHVDATGHLHREHHDLLSAVSDGDSLKVERVVAHHLTTSHEFILGHLLERNGDGLASHPNGEPQQVTATGHRHDADLSQVALRTQGVRG